MTHVTTNIEWTQIERIAKSLEELAMWAHENSVAHKDSVLDLLNDKDKRIKDLKGELDRVRAEAKYHKNTVVNILDEEGKA